MDKFIFLKDFAVLDMDEDKDVPLITSLPFLTIGWTLIDVAAVELIMRANDEQVVFNIFKEMMVTISIDDYFLVSFMKMYLKHKGNFNHQIH